MRLKFHTKLSYGIGGIADNAMYTLIGTFLLFYLTGVAKVQPAAAGTIVALGSVWECICGPIVGYMSDSIETRFGKRKPFLLLASVPCAVVSSLLFTAIDAGPGFKVVYYLIMTLLFWQCFSTFFVPYLAWGSDLTEDYHERTVLRSYAFIFNQVGMAAGMILPMPLVDMLMNMGRSKEMSWTLTGATVGIIVCFALLYCALTIRETDNPNFKKDPNRGRLISPSKIIEMFKGYFKILSLRPVRTVILSSLLFLIAEAFFLSDRVYYFSYNLNMSAGRISIIMAVITITGMALAPVFERICRYVDKKNVVFGGLVLVGVLLIFMRVKGAESFLECCFVGAVYAIGNGCYFQLVPSILYDVCEAEELVSGEKHSAQVLSLMGLCESLATAIGVQILGIILQVAGFNEALDVQTEVARTWISNCFTLVPGLVMIACALAIFRHPINGKVFNRIKEVLEDKKAGKSIDLYEFEKVFGRKYLDKLKK